MSEDLITPRLRIMPLSAAQLAQLLSAPGALEEELGFPISRSIVDANVTRAISLKLSKMAAVDSMVHDWFTYWLMVTRDEPFGTGLIGFKGFPDARGETEVGYGIDEHYRSRGYMTEALPALCAWAFTHTECRVITAKLVVNPASKRVLQKSGWEKTREMGESTDWETRRK